MPGIGSDEWIERFARAVAGIDPGEGRPVAVLHRIEGGPAWRVAIGHGTVEVRGATTDDTADLTFTWQADDAAAVARGDITALAPFQAGRLRVAGDLRVLPRVADLFARLPAIAPEPAGA